MSTPTETTPFDLEAAIAAAEQEREQKLAVIKAEREAKESAEAAALDHELAQVLDAGLIERLGIKSRWREQGPQVVAEFAMVTELGTIWTIARDRFGHWFLSARLIEGYAPETPELYVLGEIPEDRLQMAILCSIAHVRRRHDVVVADILARWDAAQDYEAQADVIYERVKAALRKAQAKHGPLASDHEAASVIREEFEEFWELVRADERWGMAGELEQLIAMGFRTIIDRKLPIAESKPF